MFILQMPIVGQQQSGQPRSNYTSRLVQACLSGGLIGNTRIAPSGNPVLERNGLGNVIHSVTTSPFISPVGSILDLFTR